MALGSGILGCQWSPGCERRGVHDRVPSASICRCARDAIATVLVQQVEKTSKVLKVFHLELLTSRLAIGTNGGGRCPPSSPDQHRRNPGSSLLIIPQETLETGVFGRAWQWDTGDTPAATPTCRLLGPVPGHCHTNPPSPSRIWPGPVRWSSFFTS